MKTRLIIWFRRHLRVKLCDVSHVFGMTSRDFSCILPAVLLKKRKHKTVKCFSKEFRSLMRLDPQGPGNWGKWIGTQYWEVCTPNNSCASLSSGNQVFDFVGEQILDRAEDIEGWSDSLNKRVLRMPDCDRMRLPSIEETACVPLTLGKVQNCVETSSNGAEGSKRAFDVQEVKAAPVQRVPPLLLRRVHACKHVASSQQHFQPVDLADNITVSEANTNDNCPVENGLHSSPEEDVNFPECFSCQRTTAYIMWSRLSCARTYRSWPFPRHGPPPELNASDRAGPRWIMTTEDSEGMKNVSNNIEIGVSANSECTVGKNPKESLGVFEPHNGSTMVQNGPGQVQSTTKSEKVLACPTSEENANDQSECQGDLEQVSTSVRSDDLQLDTPSLCSVPENFSQALDIRSTEVLSNGQQNVTPAGSVSAADTNCVELGNSSMKRTQCLEYNENDSEATTSSLQDSLPVFQGSALQNLPCINHSKDDQQTLTMIIHPYGVEPKHPSSVMVHPSEEPQSCTDAENGDHCNPKVLYTKTANQNTSSPTWTEDNSWDTPFKFMTNEDSSSAEDINTLSPSKRPKEDNGEFLFLQADICGIGEADGSPSRLSALESPVTTGGDLDVVRAYEEDAIVLDVIQDDPDLFGPLVVTTGNAAPEDQAEVQRGTQMSMQTDQTPLIRKSSRIVWNLESERKNDQSAADVCVKNHDGLERGEVNELPTGSESLILPTKWPPANPMDKHELMVQDFNNNNLYRTERTDLNVNTVNTGLTWLADYAHDSVHTISGKDINVVRPLPASYCKYYFSAYHFCKRNTCWFLHVPRDDDEKLCMDIVEKFCCLGSPIVQRAVEVFIAYYTRNSPGVSFSQNVMNQFLPSLLRLGLLRDLVSVISTLLRHKRTPPPEFVMALYEHVHNRGMQNFVPELISLTSKITEMGCVFTVEQCEMMQVHLESLHIPRPLMDIFSTVKCRALATNPHTAELSELAQAIVQVELSKQQEDWLALARVFCRVCGGRHNAGEVLRFCCCVTTALLKEPKGKLTLPYEPFAESVCQEVPSDEMVKSFLGRVGISLMFNYHRSQDWTKGVKLLRVMSRLQVEFIMLKGLFNSENGASRCQLVTIATEFFLNTGSIEGALNMLKANEWFVSSSVWPCEQVDVQNRKILLTLLAEKTSYRDTLTVLTNLPGLRQPVDGVQAGEYNAMFNAHLQRCVMKQVLPIAADTLEFMLTKGIPLDASEIQQLLHKLGKQNSWSRARSLFKHAHSAGYYSGVVCEMDCLALPCCLTEIEMTLALEMFIACNCSILHNPTDSSQPLLITLKRWSGNQALMDSSSLVAGCRLLSAALIPNPKLSIRYMAVNQEQEQLFNLDRASAAKWLSHNQSWAQRIWASSHTLKQSKTAFH